MSKPVKITKAVITAAGRGTRQYPATLTLQKEMIPLVDQTGVCKPALQLVVEEALESGLEQVCLVVQPGGETVFQKHFRALSPEARPLYEGQDFALQQSEALGRMQKAISYAIQPTPEGFGHAVYCAREFVGNQPFVLMLGDHLYLSREQRCCTRQLLDVFERYGCPVSGVARSPAWELHNFGTVAGEPLSGKPDIYEARALYEKPTPEYAREHLITPGLPEDTYLCFLGMHVFTPDIFDCLAEQIRDNRRERGEFQLTSAQELLRSRCRYLAAEVQGSRHDMGNPEGLIETQVALALRSPWAGLVRQAVEQVEEESCE